MKKQENAPEKELKEIGVSNLSDKEFRVMIVRILNHTKDIETIKKDQSEINK